MIVAARPGLADQLRSKSVTETAIIALANEIRSPNLESTSECSPIPLSKHTYQG